MSKTNLCTAPITEPAWLARLRWSIVFLLILFAVHFFFRTGRSLPSDLRCDWGVYYKAGQAMRHREPIYTLEWGPDMTFKYAPCVALAIAPFSLLPPVTARMAFFLADVVLVLV